jgi:hypothetical protein
MRLSIQAEPGYRFLEATQIMANIEASHSSDQMMLSESPDIRPPTKMLSGKSPYGDHSLPASLFGEVPGAPADNRVSNA